ncbi:hypothetical protein KR074_004461 [Drosophila pseudoananassae]|nr:hypothetical protein KR074_004461 [Drosophila pseudoananassae]
MRVSVTLLVLVLGLSYTSSKWMKKYVENYHRPTYYNKQHSSSDHVDYNRTALEERDQPPAVENRTPEPFDAVKHQSFYISILHHASVTCSGALISRRMVITSTVCFRASPRDNTHEYKANHLTVLAAIDLVPFNETLPHEVIGLYLPVNNHNAQVNHVCLLGLKHKLDHHYRYIPLYRRIPKYGDEVTITYTGAASRRLKYFRTMVLNMDRCRDYYDGLDFFDVDTYHPDYFCVRNRRHTKKTTCNTRPGDPLVKDNQLAGINIFGERCEVDDIVNMDLYLPMRPVVPFIQLATDALRAFTGTGPFNETAHPHEMSPLVKSLVEGSPNFWAADEHFATI